MKEAKAGQEWAQLRALAEEITIGLKAEEQSKEVVLHEGKGTLALIKLALNRLKGEATAREIIDWIEKNRNKRFVTCLDVCLNQNPLMYVLGIQGISFSIRANGLLCPI